MSLRRVAALLLTISAAALGLALPAAAGNGAFVARFDGQLAHCAPPGSHVYATFGRHVGAFYPSLGVAAGDVCWITRH